MRLLRATGHRRMPWKNGGGVTTEIAVFPRGAGLEDFAWRLSMATVASDGPFSQFASVDRTLVVLEGEGVLLSIEGRPEERITRSSRPVAFAADQATSARLISGPVTDLNAMTRRGAWSHRMERLALCGSVAVADAGERTVIFCASGSATISDGEESLALSQHDAAIVDTAPLEATSSAAAELYVVRLDRI